MSMKKCFTMILSFLLALALAVPAYAVMTSEEKEEKYRAAVLELEAYLESGGKSMLSLSGIEAEFETLDGYKQSKPLLYYTQVLKMIAQDDYGYELDLLLLLLEGNDRFAEYQSEVLKDSAIMPVEYLVDYVAARRNEYQGNIGASMAEYKKCNGFFDADERYARLWIDLSKKAYEEAEKLLREGDFAGAYFKFGEANRYNDSEDRRSGIVALLGYTPADIHDNPGPVTGLRVSGTDAGRITLVWGDAAHARKYEVAYRKSGTQGWTVKETTEKKTATVSGLESGTLYDFQVTAIAGTRENVRTSAELTGARIVTPVPTPSPTPLPGISVKITPKIGFNQLEWKSVSGAKHYQVYRGTSRNGKYDLLATVDGLSYTDRAVKGGVTYYYKVTAVFSNGQTVTAQESAVAATPTPKPKAVFNTPSPYYGEPVDIGVPDLKRQSFSRIFSGAGNDSYDMNIYIYWVQVQLRALGYYNGDLTGLFDRETNNAVKTFMNNRGVTYSNRIDQTVIDTIAEAIGNRRVAVKYGGFYHGLDYLLTSSQTGNMKIIWSNVNHDRYGPNPNTPYVTGGAFVVQQCLTWLGYYSKGIDGMFGSGTDESVQRFEAANGFTQKGYRQVYVTYGEVRKMMELCHARGYYVSEMDFGD